MAPEMNKAQQYFSFKFKEPNEEVVVYWSIHTKVEKEAGGLPTCICLEWFFTDGSNQRKYIHWGTNEKWLISEWWPECQRWIPIEQTEELQLLMQKAVGEATKLIEVENNSSILILQQCD